MDNVTVEFNHTPELVKRAAKITGHFETSRTRQIIISVICAIVVANTVYAFVNKRFYNAGSIIVAVAAVLIAAWIWYSPIFHLKAEIDTKLRRRIGHIEISRWKITFKNSNNANSRTVRADEWHGYKKEGDIAVLYCMNDYLILPLSGLDDEQKEFVFEVLDGYAENCTVTEDESQNVSNG